MYSNFQKLIIKICEELNINYKFLSKDWIIMLEKKGVTKIIAGYKFDLNNHGIGSVLDDKYATYDLLKSKDIKTVEHNIVYSPNNNYIYARGCNNTEYINLLFNKYNNNVVLKINNGTCGNGVYHITHFKELENKFIKMTAKYDSLSLCPYYDIESEFRAIVLNDSIELIYKKEKPIVFGNGKESIKELFMKFNPTYFKNKELPNEILSKEKNYVYDWKFNLSRGARINQNIDRFDKEKVISLVLEITKKLNLKFCSIDIIKTINNEFLTLEINSGIMMKNYIEQIPDGKLIAEKIYKKAILEMFKNIK